MPTVTLYGKAGCHLCDDAREAVERVRAERPFMLEEVDVSLDPLLMFRYGKRVDVSLDPLLMFRYGKRIPVVEVEGEELSEYVVDEAALRERLDRVASS